jgi:uncharacterized protein (TIGR03000 family)
MYLRILGVLAAITLATQTASAQHGGHGGGGHMGGAAHVGGAHVGGIGHVGGYGGHYYGYGGHYGGYGLGYPAFGFYGGFGYPVYGGDYYGSGVLSYPSYYYDPNTVGYPVAPSTPNVVVPPSQPVPSAAAATALSGTATLTAIVPEGGQVWFNDTLTQSGGTAWVYTTPPLESGKTYSVDVKARWVEGSQDRSMELALRLVAGDNMTVDFTKIH